MMAMAARGMAKMKATTRAMAIATWVEGNEEGDGKEKLDGDSDNTGDGDSNKGGGQQRGGLQGWQVQ